MWQEFQQFCYDMRQKMEEVTTTIAKLVVIMGQANEKYMP